MSARLLDTFERRLRLQGLLITRTGLHIGAGSTSDPLATDAPVVRDATGRPFIPGASLKGVLRSAAEALLRGVETQPVDGERLWACYVRDGDQHGCLSRDRLQELQHDLFDGPRSYAEAIWDETCWICRLFGSPGLPSRVRFSDLLLAQQWVLLDRRQGVGIDRDKQQAAPGILYDFEVVPPGTQFHLTVLLDNYTDAEAGLLLYLFDLLSEGFLSLGGKTSRGLGQVRVEWQTIRETSLQKNGSRENPFLDLLSTKTLLGDKDAPAEDEESTPVQNTSRDEGPALPVTGDPQAWKKLADLLRTLGEFDKSTVGQKTGEIGLNKGNLNERLGLGLEEKSRKGWDRTQELLVECGFLVEHEGRFYVAGQEPAAVSESGPQSGTQANDTASVRDPALQEIYDRYVGAMARLWQEAAV